MVTRAVIWTLLLSACTTPAIIATRSVQEGDRMNNANRYDEAIANYEQYLKVSAQLGIHRNPQEPISNWQESTSEERNTRRLPNISDSRGMSQTNRISYGRSNSATE